MQLNINYYMNIYLFIIIFLIKLYLFRNTLRFN